MYADRAFADLKFLNVRPLPAPLIWLHPLGASHLESAIPILINIGDTLPIYLPDDIKPYDNFIPASAEPTPDRPRMINTSTVNGSIKVRLGRFLHMEVSLVFTDGETQQSFRLSQSRKMRSRELHYIDNPRFGLLTRILPLDDTQSSANESETAPIAQ